MMLFTLGAKIKNLIDAFKTRVLATQGEFEAESCLEAQLTELDNDNLLDSASLIVTPNGYKETLLYAVEPNDVGTNLFLRSEEFENIYWTKGNFSTISVNSTTSPTGNNTADKHVSPAITGNAYALVKINESVTINLIYTFSVFVKQSEVRFIQLRTNINGNQFCNFDLQLGIAGTPTINTTPSIVNYGNGWYRCSITTTASSSSSTGNYGINMCNSISDGFAPNYTGTGNSGYFVWGAQLVTGSTITDYISTTDRAIINGTIGDMSVTRATTATRVNSSGLIENVAVNAPRIDYSNGSCPSILVEPQRTNLALQSEDFTTGWSLEGTSITSNTQIAPNGLLNADVLSELAIIDVHRTYRSATTVVANSLYTSSFFVKKNNIRYVRLVLTQNASITIWAGAQFDLDTQTFTSQVGIGGGVFTSATITPFANGWFRISVVGSIPSTLMIPMLVLSNGSTMLNTDTRGCPIYLGNTSNSLFIWGAQLEVGTNVTSYIPTVASTVTRNADVITNTNASTLIGQTEGTIFADVYITSFSNTGIFLSTAINGTAVRIELYKFTNGKIYFDIISDTGSLAGVASISTFTNNVRLKIALAYKSGDTVMFINGNQETTVRTNTYTITGQDRVGLGQNRVNGVFFNDFINNVALFKTRLTNTQLQNLTAL